MRLSLRARVLAGIALIVVALAVSAVIVTTTTRAHLIDQVDDRLATAGAPDRIHDGPPREPPTGYERRSDVYEGRLGADGEMTTLFPSNLSGGEELPPPGVDVDQAADGVASGEPFTATATSDDDLRYRVRTDALPDGSFWITAIPLTDVDDTMTRLITLEVVATGIILLLLAAVAWWVIRLGIRPIKQMTHTAEQIASGDLSHRVPEVSASTEAGQLGVALNQMLDHLDEAFTERAESQERLRRFVADASHELRTPVTTIRGYAELYRVGGLNERNELDEAMRRTEQEAVRMSRLVDDLLSLAKLDEGRPLEQRPVDLSQLVADAARDAAAVDPQRAITTELNGAVVVAGDEDRLRQVLANIVGNALVHTPPAAPIELRVEAAHGTARIAVTDHGHGMAPDVAARVMQRFYRADPARARDRGGSGLGLSIADAAVSAHGGEIDVDSAIGRGTTVTVTLPLP